MRADQRVLKLPIIKFVTGAVIALVLAGAVKAQDISLRFPVACELGTTCFFQQFMDRDPGPDAQDFACGTASYNGHKGTDIRVPHISDLRRGVDILAMAPGRVRGIRDGMRDTMVKSQADIEALAGKDCGNGVVIDHAGGWSTQYCHLAARSVQVASGQQVAAGDVLGHMGISGRTQFPHLHFTLRRDGVPVDPMHPEPASTCGGMPDLRLWAPLALAGYVHQPTQLIAAGFAAGSVQADALIKAAPPEPDRNTALVLYAWVANLGVEDEIELVLSGPDGILSQSTSQRVERPKAQWLLFSGRKAQRQGWPAGQYRGTITLNRSGETLWRRSVVLALD